MNLSDINNLPYRNNVCCIVYSGEEFLLLQDKGWPINWWKFPQGGINVEETLEQAALRELKEETGSYDFKIIGISKNSNIYDWNDESVRLAGYRWRGQNQKYLLVEYFGEKNNICLDVNETQSYNWVTLENLWSRIDHEDKNFTNYKNTIEKVLKEFNFI
ncbi:MAG: putative (di)nucleoside polyphosphate hydrolase [Patescibacteria group bacterium]|nr:putative (di)nucleoside polyphosphate hydrolase [Patescibacteria group bacterium]